MTRALVVRLDGMGDMVVSGPAIRAVAAGSDTVTVLAGPAGAAVARLLPGVDDVLTFAAPWVLAEPGPVVAADVARLVRQVRALRIDHAVVLTSFHQSALPTALLLRFAGVSRISAVSTDYPGALLDDRLPEPPDAPEPLRMAAIAAGAGYVLPHDDVGALRLDVPPVAAPLRPPYVVVHPGADAPSRALPDGLVRDVVAELVRRGVRVALTGRAGEGPGLPPHPRVADLRGRLDVPTLVTTVDTADAVVAGNTGPAHVAAAVDTPVVSVFAPVVPAVRWAPWGDTVTVLGDQRAACAGSRARVCPVPGHPCVSGVTADDVMAALPQAVGSPERAPAGVTR